MRKNLIFIFTSAIILTSCGGSGGSDDSAPVANGTEKWTLDANVLQNGCGKRIANVNQTITITEADGATTIDSTLIKYAGVFLEDTISFSTSTVNGDCTRTYTGVLSQFVDNNAVVDLSLKLVCPTTQCENKWSGIATKVIN